MCSTVCMGAVRCRVIGRGATLALAEWLAVRLALVIFLAFTRWRARRWRIRIAIRGDDRSSDITVCGHHPVTQQRNCHGESQPDPRGQDRVFYSGAAVSIGGEVAKPDKAHDHIPEARVTPRRRRSSRRRRFRRCSTSDVAAPDRTDVRCEIGPVAACRPIACGACHHGGWKMSPGWAPNRSPRPTPIPVHLEASGLFCSSLSPFDDLPIRGSLLELPNMLGVAV